VFFLSCSAIKSPHGGVKCSVAGLMEKENVFQCYTMLRLNFFSLKMFRKCKIDVYETDAAAEKNDFFYLLCNKI